jgi:hypothetical protein
MKIDNIPFPEIFILQLDDHLVQEAPQDLEFGIVKDFNKFCFESSMLYNHARIQKIAAQKIQSAKLTLTREIQKSFVYIVTRRVRNNFKTKKRKRLKSERSKKHHTKLNGKHKKKKETGHCN